MNSRNSSRSSRRRASLVRPRVNASACALVLLGAMASLARAQSTFAEDFRGSTAPGWVFGANPGDTLPVLTGTDDPSNGVDSNPATDLTGQGWLRLNTNATNQSTFALLDTQIFSVNANIEIEMEYAFYNGTGADGITFFLVDGSIDSSTFRPGAYGGSMGYAQKSDEAGMPGGYLGFAFDNFGNYSNGNEGRNGGITNDGTLYPNRVAVRGPESSNYQFIAASNALSQQMDFPSATSRPDTTGVDFRSFKLTIDANNQLTVQMKFGSSSDYITAFTADLAAYERPDTFKIGFTGATGSQTEIHEIRNLSVTTTPWSTGSGAYEWDNGAGTTTWGTLVGGEANTNWFALSAPSDNRTPLRDSDILFGTKPTNNGTTNTQQVQLANTVEVRNLTFDTSINYVIGQNSPGAGNQTIILGDTALVGLPSINVNDYAGATASHIINANLALAEDVAIRNFSGSSLSLNGTFVTNGNDIALSGPGVVNLNGVISGSGALVKNGTGTTTIAAANTYTGVTTVNDGTLQVNVANGLGATSSGTTVNSGGTLAYGGTGTTFASEALTLNGSGSTGQGALYNSSGTNTLGGTVALASDSSIGAASGTSVRLNGVVSGSGAFTKTGAGTVTLAGTNTHSGSVTVSAGTLAVSGGSAIGNASALTVASGATFNLSAASSSETIGSLAGGGSVVLGGNTLTHGGNNGSTTFSGVASGTGSVVKQGTGTTTLSGVNTYSGATTVSSGTLLLAANSGQALGSTSGITVNSGATLALGESNQINNAATLTLAGGTFNLAGQTEQMRQLVQSSASTVSFLNGGGKVDFLGVTGSSSGLGSLTGALTIDGWGGSFEGGGADHFVVYTTGTQAALNTAVGSGAVTFTGWGNATTVARADLGAGFYEIVPILSGNYWDVNGNGDWNDTSPLNWDDGGNLDVNGPNGTGAVAIFGNIITGAGGANTALTVNPVVNLNSDRTVGRLLFDNSAGKNYTINGSSRLTFDVASGQAQILVADNGSHVISNTDTNRVSDDLLVTNNSSATTGLTLSANFQQRVSNTDFIFSGAGTTLVSGILSSNSTTGNDLIKTGTGTLILSGANTYSGDTLLRNGTLDLRNNSAATTTGTIFVNDASTAAAMDTTLVIGTAGVSIARPITVGNYGATTTIGSTIGTGTATYSGSVTLDKSVNLSAASGGTTAFTGVISGVGGVTKTGAGTVTFSGNNTYTGATTVSAGTLRITAAERIANTSALTVASGATFDANSFSETVASLSGAGTVALGSPGSATTFTFGDATSTAFSGAITGGTNAAVVKTGSGTVTLSGASTFDGSTTIAAGTLVAASNTALGATGGDTSVTSGATLALANNITIAAGETLTLNASANNSLYNQSGSNTYAGNVVLATSANAVRIGAASGSTLTVSAPISQSGTAQSLLKTDSGTLVLSGTTANTFTGGLQISDGTVQLSKTSGVNAIGGGTVTLGDGLSGAGTAILRYTTDNQLPNSTAVSFRSDGRLDLNGRTDTIGSINSSVAGAGQILIGTGQLIVGSGNASSTFSGALSGSTGGVLEKIGTGTLTLSDPDAARADRVMSFGGEIKLEAGTLALDNLTLNVDTLRLTGNSIIDFGTSGSSTINVNKLIVELANGETTVIKNWTDLTDYLIAQSVSATDGGANIPFNIRGQSPQNRIVFADWGNGSGNNTWWQSGDKQVTPVPEPATYGALALGGLVGFALIRRRRRA